MLDSLQIFTEVAKQQSFHKASRSLSIPRSTISRHVKSLEDSLGVKLLLRTTRQISLTPEGAFIAQHAEEPLKSLQMILKMNNESEGPLTGRVRMTMPPDIGYALAPIICKKVSEEHPQLKIDIDLSARVIDLISESFDFAIRASRLLDSSYIAQKMLSIETWIVRKKCQAQAIHSIEELHDLPWLSMRGQTELKLSSKQNGQTVSLPINVRYSASDFEMIYRFVAAGLGVAQMPSLVARRYLDDGLIERILPEWSSPLHPVYLVYPSAHLMPRRTRLVINIVREILHDENKKLHNEIAHRE